MYLFLSIILSVCLSIYLIYLSIYLSIVSLIPTYLPTNQLISIQPDNLFEVVRQTIADQLKMLLPCPRQLNAKFMDHYSISKWKSNFPINPRVRLLVDWSVCTYVGRSVTKGREVTLPTLLSEHLLFTFCEFDSANS